MLRIAIIIAGHIRCNDVIWLTINSQLILQFIFLNKKPRHIKMYAEALLVKLLSKR